MATAFARAQDYTQLPAEPGTLDPYLYPRIFQGEGFFARRRLKRKFQALKNAEGWLAKALEPDEKVFFVSYGVLSSMIEAFLMGWVANIINFKAFVFTSKRILFLQQKKRHRMGELKASLDYRDIASMRKNWMGVFKIRLNNGKTLKFINTPKQDAKFIASTVQALIEASAREKREEGVVNLCPHCAAPVAGFPPQCAACAGMFKNPVKAARLSLLFPGLGDFYLGHRGLAALEMIGAAFIWISLFIPETGEAPLGPVEYASAVAIGLLFMHLPDFLATRMIARKGIYPA